MSEKIPIEESMISRVVQGVKYIVTGNKQDAWFGADNPIAPVAQEQAVGRQVDYLYALNTSTQARDYNGNQIKDKFAQLRGLADGWDLLRIVIETRKDQICSLDWTIKYKDKDKKPDARIEEIKIFFAYPDKINNHETWLRAIMEDLFVLDAPCVYPRLTRGGGLYSLDLMDGSTIKKVIDDTGRIPMPPSPAYQQILKGMAAVDYNMDELIYQPRNVRTNKLYGYSPVEQIIVTINIALRRQLGQFSYYSEGNIPEALASVPPDWSVAQVKEFQQYWDATIEGNMAAKRKLKFIPDGIKYIPTKEPILKDEYDEWLARVVCYAFSVSNQAFAKMMNRATAETAKDQATDEGLLPLMNWVKNFHNFIISKYFGENDIEFAWEKKISIDPKTQADIHQIYKGVLTVNEIREDLGREPLNDEELALLNPIFPSFPNYGSEEPKEETPILSEEEDKQVGKSQKAFPILKNFTIEKAYKTKAERVARKQSAVAKKLQDSLNDLKDEVSYKITNEWGNKDNADDYLKLIDDVDFSIIGSSIEDDITKSFKTGSSVGFNQIDYTPDKDELILMNEKALDWAKERGLELAKLDESTKDFLRPTIEKAITEGLTVSELSSELRENYAFSKARATTIARTELAFSDSQGNFEAWKQSGLVTHKRSILGTNENHGEDDIANAEQGAIPFDDEFQSGHLMPPYHPNCICDVIPILEGEEENE